MLREWICRLVAGKELDELARWNVEWHWHRQWLTEFSDVAATLDNMRLAAKGHAHEWINDLRNRLRDNQVEPAGRNACNGSRLLSAANDLQDAVLCSACDACNGSGLLSTTNDPQDAILCPACEGSGTQYEREQREPEAMTVAAATRALDDVRRVIADDGYAITFQSLGAYRSALLEALARSLSFVPRGYDLVTHIHRQRAFSRKTFGPGPRTAGVIAHIRKELTEIEAAPDDITEWADVILLALDGAWRAGHEPEAIAAAIEAKQTRNENRTWPDWRTAPADGPIEHVRNAADSEGGEQ